MKIKKTHLPIFIGMMWHGIQNVVRTPSRSVVVVLLLTAILTSFALLAGMSLASGRELRALEIKTQTLIELREAGAFGTGGFGGDKPVGEHDFTMNTLRKALQIPNKQYIVRADEYVYVTDINTTFPNAYAMIIGVRPGAELRAIGEIDYEAVHIIAGHDLQPDDATKQVAVMGKTYAEQRMGYTPETLIGKVVAIKGMPFTVVGVFDTGNEFSNNQVFAPFKAVRKVFRTGEKLSKIFITVDSVHHVDFVAKELASIKEADVVTTPNAVRTAKRSLGGIALTTRYGAIILFIAGGVLLMLIMMLSTREKIREFGILKALGGSSGQIVPQLFGEAMGLVVPAALFSAILARFTSPAVHAFLDVSITVPISHGVLLGISALGLVGLSSLYPWFMVRRLSPLEAVRRLS